MKYENSMVKIADDIVKKCKDNSFQSVRFSTDYGYATSLNLRVYLWEDEIEGQEPVMVEFVRYWLSVITKLIHTDPF